MNKTLMRIAAVLALILGLMGVFAGGQAMLGKLPGWNVISWLPVYNFIAGLLATFLVAPLIWRGSRFAMPAALTIFGANLVVVLALQLAFRDAVARESMVAMFLRLGVWIVILVLMWLPHFRRGQPGATASAG
jgi:hypothetical protein